MRAAAQHGLLTLVHAENGDVIDVLVAEALQQGRTSPVWHARTRPAWGEVEASLRAVALAAQADAPVYLVHMNVAGEVDQLAYGRSHGVRAMGETCPQYLFFTEKDLERPDGTKWLCSPPLRSPADQQGLWRGLENGTIQVLATDHCPFFYDGTQPITYEGEQVAMPGKELGRGIFTQVPNGVPGVGDRLPVFWTHAVHSGRISPNQFAALSSAIPPASLGSIRAGCLPPVLMRISPSGTGNAGELRDPGCQTRTDYNLTKAGSSSAFRGMFSCAGMLVRDGKWFDARHGQFLHRQSGEVI
jgi:dihydropyrimidinase